MSAAELAAVKAARMRLIVFRWHEGEVGAEASVVLAAVTDELAAASMRRLDIMSVRQEKFS